MSRFLCQEKNHCFYVSIILTTGLTLWQLSWLLPFFHMTLVTTNLMNTKQGPNNTLNLSLFPLGKGLVLSFGFKEFAYVFWRKVVYLGVPFSKQYHHLHLTLKISSNYSSTLHYWVSLNRGWNWTFQGITLNLTVDCLTVDVRDGKTLRHCQYIGATVGGCGV